MTTLAFALRARTFRSLRRHRNYRIFFTGQLVSLAGTWMQNVALAWLVLELSSSPLAVGALMFWRFVPFTVFGLLAGAGLGIGNDCPLGSSQGCGSPAPRAASMGKNGNACPAAVSGTSPS